MLVFGCLRRGERCTQASTPKAACWMCSETFFFVEMYAERPINARELPTRRTVGINSMSGSFGIFVILLIEGILIESIRMD
jgi:hypothetical protein